MENNFQSSDNLVYQELTELLHKEILKNYKNIREFCRQNGITNYNGLIKLLNGEYQPKKIIQYLSIFGYAVEEEKCFKISKQDSTVS
jgi:hypothetical protein